MRKLLAASVSVLVLLSAVALAAPSSDHPSKDKTIIGTVSQVDATEKSMVVKDSTNKEVTIYWNDTTKFEGGQPQEGASVTVDVNEQDGKTWAKSIQTRPPKKPY